MGALGDLIGLVFDQALLGTHGCGTLGLVRLPVSHL